MGAAPTQVSNKTRLLQMMNDGIASGVVQPLDSSSHRRIVVLTGAGISVASGLPPYRGPGGLWTMNPKLRALDDAEAIQRDPMAVGGCSPRGVHR